METQQTTEAAPAAAPLPEGNPEVSLDERAASLLDVLKGEGAAPAAEPAEGEPVAAAKPAKVADPAAPVEAVAKTPDQIAEERRQRIAARDADIQKLAEDERARVAASRQRKQERQPAEAPPSPATPAGLAVTDVASFWRAAESLNIPPGEMAAWLSGQSDPVATAKHAAKEALTPVEKKLAELEAKQAQWEAQQREAQQAAQLSQVVARNMQILNGHLETVKAEAPLTAAFRANAPEDFEAAVNSVADQLPPGFTAQDVIDQLEENLTKFHKALQLTAPTAPSTPQRTAKPAAAKANVGNRLASERATTVEDDDTDVAPDLEDRARQLKARLAAG